MKNDLIVLVVSCVLQLLKHFVLLLIVVLYSLSFLGRFLVVRISVVRRVLPIFLGLFLQEEIPVVVGELAVAKLLPLHFAHHVGDYIDVKLRVRVKLKYLLLLSIENHHADVQVAEARQFYRFLEQAPLSL